jgi:hypothetical protein
MNFHVSKITSLRGINGTPPRLCKLITREDGKLKSIPGANLINGKVEKIVVTSLQALGELFDSLGTDQALTYGVTVQDALILSRAELERTPVPGAITRTNDHFKFGDGAGVLFLDYDPPKGTPPLSPRELVDTIRAAVPELEAVELLWRPSSSSCIFDAVTGEQLTGIKGQHLYCIVQRATDIPAMIKTIEARLWLAGFGRVELSEAGTVLYKTLIDDSVAQPERLDFTRADCGPGLVQRMEPSRVFLSVADELMGGVPDLFTAPVLLSQIKPMTDAEGSAVPTIKADAASAPNIVQRAAEVKHAHRLELARKRAKPGEDVEALALSIGRDLDAGCLSADHVIKLQDRTSVTVADILKNPAAFHGKKCADPLEPDYGDRRTVGLILTDRYPPRVTTMAHGGGVYYLFNWQSEVLAMFDVLPDQAIAALRMMTPDDILAQWVDLALPRGHLGAKAVLDEVHRLTGTGKRVLAAMLREKREAVHAKQKAVSVARRTGDRQNIIHRPEDASAQAALVEALIVKNSKPGDYVQFSGVLSHVVTKTPRYAHEIDNPDNPAPPVLQIEPLNAVEILRKIEGEVVFVNVNLKGEKTPMGVPGPIQNILRDKTDHAAPYVTGIASHPIVMRDGGILSADGLDTETGLFLVGAAVPGVRVFDKPEAVQALARLRLALGEGFEFATPQDLEIAVAALLTGIQRRTLDQAPGLAVMASAQSSGKTTLARMIHVLLTGQDMAVSAFTDDSDEAMTKRLISTLMGNPAMVCFDNIKDGFTFRSAPVATCMTTAVFKDRLLGFSRDVECPTNTLFVLTGNNVSLGADEVTRWMICRLAPKTARPEQRTFKNPDVVDHALSIRESVLRDAVGIIAGYRTHAANSIKGCSRFAAWDKMIRQPLLWAGGDDVATVFDRNDLASEENNAHRGLLLALKSTFGSKWFTGREVATANTHSLDGTAVADCLSALRVSKVTDPRSVGHCLTAKTGRTVTVIGGELVLKAVDDPHTGIKRYQVAGMCGVI